jgi:RNA polymerase sigma factor (sigma-70 family)
MFEVVRSHLAGAYRVTYFVAGCGCFDRGPDVCKPRCSSDICVMSAPLAVIHLVDDDAAFRTAISRLLKASSYDVVVHASANELFEMPPGTDRGCILLDVKMPGLDGLEVQNRLSNSGCHLPIVFLTGYGDIATSVRAIKAGAEDFLSKPVAKNKLLDAIGRALLRYDEAHERNSRLDVLQGLVATLTPRQREVFVLVVRGKLNKQIAHELGTSERTVKAHRHSVMHKLQVKSLAEVVSIAERLGLMAETVEGRAKRSQ